MTERTAEKRATRLQVEGARGRRCDSVILLLFDDLLHQAGIVGAAEGVGVDPKGTSKTARHVERAAVGQLEPFVRSAVGRQQLDSLGS